MGWLARALAPAPTTPQPPPQPRRGVSSYQPSCHVSAVLRPSPHHLDPWRLPASASMSFLDGVQVPQRLGN